MLDKTNTEYRISDEQAKQVALLQDLYRNHYGIITDSIASTDSKGKVPLIEVHFHVMADARQEEGLIKMAQDIAKIYCPKEALSLYIKSNVTDDHAMYIKKGELQ